MANVKFLGDYANQRSKYKAYRVKSTSTEDGFNIDYCLGIPEDITIASQLIFESNNDEYYETDEEHLRSTMATAGRIANAISVGVPIIVPMIPKGGKQKPYYQQLSPECFEESKDSELYRIDLQMLRMIENAKKHIEVLKDVKIKDRIFLNGYSSSGVFAQRFALLHPEIVDAACIGGAVGSIPMPMEQYNGIELQYPIGISNIEKITGKGFNETEYKRIHFAYYVGEREEERRSSNWTDENGRASPMHDMSYNETSMPSSTGRVIREVFGTHLLERLKKQAEIYRSLGYRFKEKIFAGKTHNGEEGIRESADIDIDKFYRTREGFEDKTWER